MRKSSGRATIASGRIGPYKQCMCTHHVAMVHFVVRNAVKKGRARGIQHAVSERKLTRRLLVPLAARSLSERPKCVKIIYRRFRLSHGGLTDRTNSQLPAPIWRRNLQSHAVSSSLHVPEFHTR